MALTERPRSSFPARLHVLLARDAPLGVVIRRGPSRSVYTLLWDRRRDTLRLGQWLRGRIYERRSDLSPDGRHLIYFAMNGKWTSEAKGAWTAVSRAPYLKALAIFPKGDCWHGGGLFTAPRRYWLNDGAGHAVLRDAREVRRDRGFRPQGLNAMQGECLGVYYPRLQRDGWHLVATAQSGRWQERHVFDKPLPQGWMLRKIAHAQIGAPPGRGCYWDEHALVRDEVSIPCPDWEWAEVDGARLVWAARGRLYTGRPGDKGIVRQRELYDFNPLGFTPLAAPY